MELFNLYPIPTWHDVLPVTENDRIKAIEYCKYIQKENSTGKSFTNKGGWQSQSLVYGDLINTPLEIYFRFIRICIEKAFDDLGSSRLSEFGNAWININGKNDYNRPHVHPGSMLSGCFYLTDNNSELVLKRPTDANFALIFGMSSRSDTPLSQFETVFKPKVHDLYIFPSWMVHDVMPNLTDHERISVAFNVHVGNFR